MKKIILVLLLVAGVLGASEFSKSEMHRISKAIQISGYVCAYVNSARVDYSGVITAYCEDYKRAFTIRQSGGNWIIVPND
ncbi:MAG: hypothetical protein J7L21_03240 [Sulfurimonas sp.]|nr:hypothetical protein [Sulfurimonas sp.]